MSVFDVLIQVLFEHLANAAHACDEANAMSNEMRPSDRLRFEVELIWDIHRDAKDVIVIRVMRFEHDGDDQATVLHYWTQQVSSSEPRTYTCLYHSNVKSSVEVRTVGLCGDVDGTHFLGV